MNPASGVEAEIIVHVWLASSTLSVEDEKVSTSGFLKFYSQYGGGDSSPRVVPSTLSAEVEINLHVWLPRVLLSVWRNEKVSTRGSLEFYLQYGGGYNYSRVAPLSTLGVEAKPDTSPRVAP